MGRLNDIGVACGTDKSRLTHWYLENYENHFNDFLYAGKEFILLEIGVGNGSSIKMWREYFPMAKVYGIDINKDCAGEGIFIGSQSDEEFLKKVIEEIGHPDIVIDDASHYSPLTIKTFELLFPVLNKGGWYVVEDTHCFYDKTYGLAPDFDKGMSDVFNFFSGLAAHVDVQGRGMTGNANYALSVQNENFAPIPKYSPILESMHIHPSLWFFKRR